MPGMRTELPDPRPTTAPRHHRARPRSVRAMRALTLAFGLVLGLACSSCSDAPRDAATADVTLADLNFLHGLFCPEGSDDCRLPDRTQLLFDFVVARGCPDVVTLQEIWPPSVALMEPYLASACPFTYELVRGERRTDVDDEAVLSRYPVLSVAQRTLFPRFRRVLHLRVAHPRGDLDVYTTHLGSNADGGPQPCGDDCPAECVAAGAVTIRDCQAVQMAAFVDETHDPALLGLVSGDFNETPGSFVYDQFTRRGFVDAYLAAGNPECDRATGTGCTSGRADEELTELESPVSNETERIDFVFVVPPADPATCAARVVPAGDDGGGTRLFADEPNPFAPSCGAAPLPICWPSDHVGVQVALGCG